VTARRAACWSSVVAEGALGSGWKNS